MKRVMLRAKDAKSLLQGFLEEYSWISGIDTHSRVEVVQLDTIRLFYVNGFPLILETQRRNIPTLISKDVLKGMPIVVVDMGAVPFICRGADIMAPGVKSVGDSFPKDAVVQVVDERYRKTLSIGIALMASSDFAGMKQGQVIENLHYVGDTAWKLIFKSA